MKYVMHLVLNEYGVKHVIVANAPEVGSIPALIEMKKQGN
ncbi:GDSL family lipase [Wolbachia pipientis]|uniref:GDSL family lipase n=1 Tax=Wolbachia pipientis TaxID=955 RepID=A0A6C1U2J5_WOLPI|nr:GDSL family lipase [Wolbachia pipientis]